MSWIDWSKAPAWAECVIRSTEDEIATLYWSEAFGTIDGKRCAVGSEWRRPGVNDLANTAGKNHCWILVERRPAKAWSGYGLPPVGTVCEILSTPEPNGLWCKGIILYISNSSCVWAWDINQIDLCANTFDMQFRPIRTPEQIAADQRLHDIRNVCTAISKTLDGLHESQELTAVMIIEAMLDAGYCKQATK